MQDKTPMPHLHSASTHAEPGSVGAARRQVTYRSVVTTGLISWETYLPLLLQETATNVMSSGVITVGVAMTPGVRDFMFRQPVTAFGYLVGTYLVASVAQDALQYYIFGNGTWVNE